MTEAESVHALTAIVSLTSLALLWALLMWAWPKYRVDRFRSEIFTIRDDLFDMACRGEIGFQDPAYGHVRTILNGYIRFAFRLSTLAAVLDLMFVRSRDYRRSSAWDEVVRLEANLAALPAGSRERVMALVERMHREVAYHIATLSPLLCMIVGVLSPVIAIVYIADRCVASASSVRRRWAALRDKSIRRADGLAFAAGA